VQKKPKKNAGPHMVGGIDGALVGVHAFSKDGLGWMYGGFAYTNSVNLTDGSTLVLNRRERHVMHVDHALCPRCHVLWWTFCAMFLHVTPPSLHPFVAFRIHLWCLNITMVVRHHCNGLPPLQWFFITRWFIVNAMVHHHCGGSPKWSRFAIAVTEHHWCGVLPSAPWQANYLNSGTKT
jgi:hypothetical protein